MRHCAAALALAGLVAACTEPVAPRVDPPAYDPTQLSGVLYRWPVGHVIAVYADPTAVAPGVDLPAALSQAEGAWKAALGGSEFSFRAALSPQDADVIVHASTAPRLVGLAGCPAPPAFASGSTFFCPATDSALTLPLLSGAAGQVKVDVTVNLEAAGVANPLAALIVHELGHAVGIGGHSPDAGDVMYPSPTASLPSMRDVTTLRWVVRQRAELRL